MRVFVCGKPANAQVHLGVKLIQPCGPTEGPQARREDRTSRIYVVAIGAAKEHASGTGFGLEGVQYFASSVVLLLFK